MRGQHAEAKTTQAHKHNNTKMLRSFRSDTQLIRAIAIDNCVKILAKLQTHHLTAQEGRGSFVSTRKQDIIKHDPQRHQSQVRATNHRMLSNEKNKKQYLSCHRRASPGVPTKNGSSVCMHALLPPLRRPPRSHLDVRVLRVGQYNNFVQQVLLFGGTKACNVLWL